MENKPLAIADYVVIMNNCIQEWNRADAEAVASNYTDDLYYSDPSVPMGINGKEEFIKYLKLIFKLWPQQEWIPGESFEHKNGSSFSGCYRFKFANKDTEIKGYGMDIIEFADDKIRKNYVYLNAEKWNKWLKKELSQHKEL